MSFSQWCGRLPLFLGFSQVRDQVTKKNVALLTLFYVARNGDHYLLQAPGLASLSFSGKSSILFRVWVSPSAFGSVSSQPPLNLRITPARIQGLEGGQPPYPRSRCGCFAYSHNSLIRVIRVISSKILRNQSIFSVIVSYLFSIILRETMENTKGNVKFCFVRKYNSFS